jgi:hypothetical protein
MSFTIDIDHVTHVLLADGWHEVQKNSLSLDTYSLSSDVYEYLTADRLDPGGPGGGQEPSVAAKGFRFVDAEQEVGTFTAGPLTSILAVRYQE